MFIKIQKACNIFTLDCGIPKKNKKGFYKKQSSGAFIDKIHLKSKTMIY